jgi:hypothetical protein
MKIRKGPREPIWPGISFIPRPTPGNYRTGTLSHTHPRWQTGPTGQSSSSPVWNPRQRLPEPAVTSPSIRVNACPIRCSATPTYTPLPPLCFPSTNSTREPPGCPKSSTGVRLCRRCISSIPAVTEGNAAPFRYSTSLSDHAHLLIPLAWPNLQPNDLPIATRSSQSPSASPAVALFRIWKQSRKDTTHASLPRPPASCRDVAVVQESL